MRSEPLVCEAPVGDGVVVAVVISSLVLAGLVLFVIHEARAAKLVSARSDDWFGRLTDGARAWSPFLIGLIWIFYGVLHLASAKSALNQMHKSLGDWRPPLFSVSGTFEILLGLLTIAERWRRFALQLELGFLVVLSPFVALLLVSDCAIADLFGTAFPFTLSRVVVVFHNILLFVWIYATYAKTSPQPPRPIGIPRPSPVLIVALVMLAANVAGFAAIAATPWYQAVLQLWAMAALASGALVGFIFGVPKWTRPKTVSSERERYEPNTNIEKLSDWLTKILVGVGLVEFHELGPIVNRMSDRMTAGLSLRGGAHRSALEAHALGNAILVYFFVAGAIQGFLLTRMFLSRAWQSDEARIVGTDGVPPSGG
jgi:hypothetical protein